LPTERKTVQIFGVDFTSAPGRRKPITCARCRLEDERLRVEAIETFPDFAGFEALLRQPGTWIAGIDFPFGQPRRLLEQLGWPLAWDRCVAKVARMPKTEFVNLLVTYAASRPHGDRHHRRETDKRAKACSPMMVYGVPVGRMFYEGATRLLRSEVSVTPNRPTSTKRIAIEAYPALVARFLGQPRYKGRRSPDPGASRRDARRAILRGLGRGQLQSTYGTRVQLGGRLAEPLVEDDEADRLDAVLCAVQAAWSWLNRDRHFGVPADCDTLEGWICDPSLHEP
jgi:hypothetical protein